MLYLDIYGLKCRLVFSRKSEKKGIRDILSLFIKPKVKPDVVFDYLQTGRVQDIGPYLFYPLSRRNIFTIHAAGIHYKNGVHLIAGVSSSGKSTLSCLALKYDFSITGDDIVLVRANRQKIEALPFYSRVFLKNRTIIPGREVFKPGPVTALVFPQYSNGPVKLKKITDPKIIMRLLSRQFLWAYEKKALLSQKNLFQELCRLPAYDLEWNKNKIKNKTDFMRLFDEIVQG